MGAAAHLPGQQASVLEGKLRLWDRGPLSLLCFCRLVRCRALTSILSATQAVLSDFACAVTQGQVQPEIVEDFKGDRFPLEQMKMTVAEKWVSVVGRKKCTRKERAEVPTSCREPP